MYDCILFAGIVTLIIKINTRDANVILGVV